MKEGKNFILNVEKERFKPLKNIFGSNFDPKTSFDLKQDIDSKNELRGFKEYSAYWVKLKNPGSGEVVEAKVYLPRNGNVKKMFIICPGYRGDFVLQEADYADALVKEERALIVLRHNGMRVDKNSENYIHCPERIALAKNKIDYLGDGQDFKFDAANHEVLTVLKSLGDKIDNLNKIDVLGHSWGGRISLMSVLELLKESKDKENSQKVLEKLDYLILLGAWLKTANTAEEIKDIFEDEERTGYFKNLDIKEVTRSVKSSSKEINNIGPEALPNHLKIVGVQSEGDTHVDLENEFYRFFAQLKPRKKTGTVMLKDLKGFQPDKIGGRESEAHDYAIDVLRNWLSTL